MPALNPPPHRRGSCSICQLRVRLRRDGMCSPHIARIASHPLGRCSGSLQPPMPGTITETGKHTRQ